MPTRVLLEGPAIEPLLAQVRQEYGTSVRILSADKVRTGGFGGFFAKQRYELSIEVPDGTTRSAAPPEPEESDPADGPALTLEQLLDRAEARDRFAGQLADSGPTDPAYSAATDPGNSAADPGNYGPTDPAYTAAAAADQSTEELPLAAANGGPVPRGGLVSTNGSTFADVMARLNGVAVTSPGEAPPVDADRRRAAPTVTVMRVAEVTDASATGPVEILRLGERAADARPAGTPTVRPFRPPTVSAAAEPEPPAASAAAALSAYAAAAPAPAAPAPAAPTPAAPALAAPAPVVPAPAAPAPVVPVVHAPVTPVPAAPVPVAPVEVPALAPVHPADALVADLVDLGMPAFMAARVTAGDAYSGVLQALAELPDAPRAPDRAGEVLVIAGDLAHALPVARKVVEHLRLDASRLLLAGPSAAGTGIHPARKLSGPTQAERKARLIHRGDTPYVVVLDAPVTGMNEHWARDTCDALGATAVWTVVDATRKTADTRSHLRALGQVEAVAVYGAAETADPASVLALNVPIVTVDGQQADRHAWAALLCQRLTRSTTTTAERRRRRGR